MNHIIIIFYKINLFLNFKINNKKLNLIVFHHRIYLTYVFNLIDIFITLLNSLCSITIDVCTQISIYLKSKEFNSFAITHFYLFFSNLLFIVYINLINLAIIKQLLHYSEFQNPFHRCLFKTMMKASNTDLNIHFILIPTVGHESLYIF